MVKKARKKGLLDKVQDFDKSFKQARAANQKKMNKLVDISFGTGKQGLLDNPMFSNIKRRSSRRSPWRTMPRGKQKPLLEQIQHAPLGMPPSKYARSRRMGRRKATSSHPVAIFMDKMQDDHNNQYTSKMKRMNYRQAKKAYNLFPFADADRDGVLNKFDCRPFDWTKHMTDDQRKAMFRKMMEAGTYDPSKAKPGGPFTKEDKKWMRWIAKGRVGPSPYEKRKKIPTITVQRNKLARRLNVANPHSEEFKKAYDKQLDKKYKMTIRAHVQELKNTMSDHKGEDGNVYKKNTFDSATEWLKGAYAELGRTPPNPKSDEWNEILVAFDYYTSKKHYNKLRSNPDIVRGYLQHPSMLSKNALVRFFEELEKTKRALRKRGKKAHEKVLKDMQDEFDRRVKEEFNKPEPVVPIITQTGSHAARLKRLAREAEAKKETKKAKKIYGKKGKVKY